MSTLPTHIARYSVVEPIAAGGMGEVFLARDDRLDRLVAIKLLRDGFDSEELRSRFEEEARNVAKLTHPNIVTIYEYGAHEGRPYIAMEYVAGHSMADLVRRKMPLSLARRVRLIEELCAGLGHAHKAHLVHRDIKPANLMVSTSGMLKVLDFGIAKLRGTDRTQKGLLVGTVNYMSPEQITGQPVDHRSDIFAVGLVLHEVLTYDQAFKGDLTTAMFAIVHGQAEPLAARCPGLDPGFQTVVNRCLAKSPTDRYQDLSVLKRDLGRLRRPLEDEDGEMADTIGPFLDDKTILVSPDAAAAHTEARVAGPDTRRARESAVAAGEAAIARGLFESALRHAEQALALESDNAAARDLLERARRAIDAAKAESQVGRAREALAADRLAEARSALAAAAALAPEATAARDLGLQIERRAADLARFDEAMRGARARLDERDVPEARRLAATAARIRPDDADVQDLRQHIDRVADELREAAEEAARQAEAQRVAQEQQRADAERVAREQQRAEAERVALEQRQAEAARLAQKRREAEAARAEEKRRAEAERQAQQEQRAAEAARLAQETQRADAARVAQQQRDAEAARLAQEARAREAAIARLAQEAHDAEARSAAESSAPTQFLDAPTQVVDLRATADDVVVSGPSALSSTPEVAEARDWPVEAVPDPVPARSRRPLMAIAAAAVLILGMWLWSRRADDAPPADTAATTPSTEAPATSAAPVVTTADSPAPPGAPLGAAPLTGPDVLSEFKNGPMAQPGRRDPVVPSPSAPTTGATTTTAARPTPGPTPGSTSAPLPAPPSPTAPAAVGSGTGANTGPSVTITPPAPRPVPPPLANPTSPVSAPAERFNPNPGAATTATPTSGAATPIATPAPVPAPATPPSDGGAAARQLDESSIRRLVNAFGQAYQSKDLKALRTVWPDMTGGDESSYRNVFNSYRSINWTTGDTSIRFDSERADVRSSVQVTQRALRPDTTTTQNRTYRFRFERRGTGWRLLGVENLGAAR